MKDPFKKIDKIGTSLLVVFALFLVLTTSAIAETKMRAKPIQCGPKASLLQMIEEAGEEALVGGVGEVLFEDGQKSQLAVTFFANPIEGTWTLVEFHDPIEACVIGYGGSLTFDVQQYFKKKESL